MRTYYHAERFREVTRLGVTHTLDDELHELLDIYDRFAADPQNCFTLCLEAGDIQWLSNHSVVHARTLFVDDPAPDRRRHLLLRLWCLLQDRG